METTILFIVNIFSAVAIIALALLQQSKGDMGSAFGGGGGSQSMFGSRGSANFLSRTTAIMCAVFFLSSLSLAYIYSNRAENQSVVEQSVLESAGQTAEEAASTEVPALPDSVDQNESTTSLEQAVPEVPAEESTDSTDIVPSVPSETQ